MMHFLPAFIICILTACSLLPAQQVSPAVSNLLAERCVDCHNADTKNGGIDLQKLRSHFDRTAEVDAWAKVEAAIGEGKMPPEDETPLTKDETKVFANWFEEQFVKPSGIQHAGPAFPRRLTREELQNTLEDILQIHIRADVTNSRLHVIPDTVIEKFFPMGVIGESGFSNDAATLSKESVNIQSLARCFALILSMAESDKKSCQHLFAQDAIPANLSTDEARKVVAQFGKLAFRRELTDSELNAFINVFETMQASRSDAESIKSTFLAILLSPAFLYRFETLPETQTLVSDRDMAVRLAYFLWSAPPDQLLWDLANSGELNKPEILKAQVRRMLRDPRRIALAENLGGEWFDYKKLRQHSAVNKRSDKMAGFFRTQYEEALLFFDGVIRFDRSILNLVDADWAFMNRHQAGIYQLNTEPMVFDKSSDASTPLPPISIHFRHLDRQITQGNYEYKHAPLSLVKLTDRNRGGYITLGSTLSVTSTENRTSPIRRGVWVLERILGMHFEVPEDVPDLEASQKKAESKQLNLTHVEILKLHSSQDGCAACHQYIDPIGFGLETFDQLGLRKAISQPDPTGEKLHWTADTTPPRYQDVTWPLSEPLVAGKEYTVFFQFTKGSHRLDVKQVRLTNGDIKLIDRHFGFTGSQQQNNAWFFTLPDIAPEKGWQLTAKIRGNGGTDSNGTITLSDPHVKHPGHLLPNGKGFSTPHELKNLLLDDYRDQIINNAIKRVLAYALGRKILPLDRPAIDQIRHSITADQFRMNALIEAVVLSHPFRHIEVSPY